MKGIVNFSEIEFTQNGKVPPSCVDIERDVLGAILLDPGSFELAHSYLQKSETFYKPEHIVIYESIIDIAGRFQKPDVIAVVQDLKKKEQLDFVGGPYSISQLTNGVIGSLNLERDCLLMREKYIRRSLIGLSASLFRLGFDETSDTLDIVDYAERVFDDMVHNMASEKYQTASFVASKVIDSVEQLMKREIDITGIPSGFETLDKATCGFQKTDLIIIAARPSVGKTAWALNVARNAAKAGKKIGFFSLEMSKKQLVERLISTSSGIRLDKIKRGRLDDHEFKKLLIHSGYPEFENMFIDDAAGINIFELRSKARRMLKDGCDMIIIDYLQLMSGAGKSGTREQEISGISQGLKKSAKEMDIPIIALSQLSRAVETRGGGDPKLSDLRESGAIEQDADLVGFLTREDYQQDTGNVGDFSNKGFLKIKKHRNGPLVDIPFRTKFETQEWIEDNGFPQVGPSFIPFSRSNYEKETEDEPF